MTDLSLTERKELALNLNGEFEKIGFKTVWLSDAEFQVEELPILKIVPLDTAKLSIRVEEYGIYFEITIKFIKVLEDLYEAEEINKVFDLHNDKWLIELGSYFSNMDPNGVLKWDVEYDEYIESSLYGTFDSADDIVAFARGLKELIYNYPS